MEVRGVVLVWNGGCWLFYSCIQLDRFTPCGAAGEISCLSVNRNVGAEVKGGTEFLPHVSVQTGTLLFIKLMTL